ncbi:MAG: WYL domain-containing protein [Actinomycetaceae bacterium]|nr:WYL domain-containing protein [Actinomycetaceae bacterium]
MSENIPRAQRLMSLVLALSDTERGLTKEKILATVRGYQDGTSESIEKRFTRDKNDLSALGFNIEVKLNHMGEDCYVITKHAKKLSATLTPQERVLAEAAANLWSDTDESDFHARILAIFGSADGESSIHPASSQLSGAKAIATISRAISAAKPIVFSYVKTDSAKAEKRTVEPWYLFLESGNLYVRGFDRARKDDRVFRISRISGKSPLKMLEDSFTHPTPQGAFTGLDQIKPLLAVKSNTAQLIRQHGHVLENRSGELPAGWDLIEGADASFSEWIDRILSQIENVVVLEPADLRGFIDDRIDALAKEDHRG